MGKGFARNHGAVDVTSPDLRSHPKYADATGLRCRIKPGDAIFVPSRWSHAVRSAPTGPKDGCRNIAVNFWYVHPAA